MGHATTILKIAAGDVMYDAALFYRGLARRPEWFPSLGLAEGEFVLATVHRAENTDDPERLSAIFEGLGQSQLPIVLPLHPRTRGRLEAARIVPARNIHIVEPVGYLEMVWLESACRLIASDSGGVQKEAYFHGRRCIILRDETEWVELVDAGWNVIAGSHAQSIAAALAEHLPVSQAGRLYGNGDASARIVYKIAV